MSSITFAYRFRMNPRPLYRLGSAVLLAAAVAALLATPYVCLGASFLLLANAYAMLALTPSEGRKKLVDTIMFGSLGLSMVSFALLWLGVLR
jgi:hypothetical protein